MSFNTICREHINTNESKPIIGKVFNKRMEDCYTNTMFGEQGYNYMNLSFKPTMSKAPRCRECGEDYPYKGGYYESSTAKIQPSADTKAKWISGYHTGECINGDHSYKANIKNGISVSSNEKAFQKCVKKIRQSVSDANGH